MANLVQQDYVNSLLEELQVLDIKFLYGCSKPTIVVLYQDNKDARHVKTYEVALKDKDFAEGPWSQNNLDNGADLLIPVPPPLCGVLIIGEETIVYCSANTFKAIPIRPSITKAYGRVDADGSRYLLGDHAGLLHLLVITHEKEKVTGLKIELLGETSIASTISYLDNAFVYIGSSYGDSQLIKLNVQPDAKGSYVEVLERYVNLGPIVDFCVVDLERQGQGQVVTCSGAYKDGSLRIVRNGIGINEQASVELQGIKGMWSLRSSTDDPFDTFLVVSFISETRILAMNLEDELEETEIEGFCSQAQTLFCHDAVFNQLVQVTSSSVRLVSSTSRELRNEWKAPAGYSVNVATANATQVLLATGGGHLVYLEIGDGTLTEVKHAQLEYEISCLDINPIGENPNYSQIAAVGMWTDITVRIFSLPDLNLITKEHLGGEIIPRSVLLCAFEGVCYFHSVASFDGSSFDKIEERARDYNANWMSAVEILDDDIYLGAESNFNLVTVRKNSEGATDEERGRLEHQGKCHRQEGEFVNRFRHGSLVMRLPDSDVGQIPTVIFGTVNGVIGVIASLPQEQYVFLEKLQSNIRKVIKGVGGLNHEQWRSFNNEKKTVDAKNFLDGDLIESFLDLSRSRMDEISKTMNVSVEELCKRVEELTRLH
ncbi:DNA damage-binding protein 1-like [Mangifera indica]|uniref:DNA damage-binding protein 1-like n=1 Tax=Mangifera indica TaxID=29780 RepID=UPI001CFA2355|nr:DNA damage-binding protein 1-like [Mangifera indica]